MRRSLLCFPGFLFGAFAALAQGNEPVAQSPKPKISVNGTVCSIDYEQYTCVPKQCDSVIIMPGEQVEFCTGTYTELSDPQYYIQWNFTGSDLPLITDYYPAQVPLCYYPVWTISGTHEVIIDYLGSQSVCCCNYVPSRWKIKVHVIAPSAVTDNFSCDSDVRFMGEELFLDPGCPGKHTYELFGCDGRLIASGSFQDSGKFKLSLLPGAIYFCRLISSSFRVSVSRFIAQ